MIYILPFFNLAANRRNTIDFDFSETHRSFTRVCLHSLTHLSLIDGWVAPTSLSLYHHWQLWRWFEFDSKENIYIPSARQKSLKQHFSSFGSCPPHPTHFQNNEKAHPSAHTTTNDHPLFSFFCTDFFLSFERDLLLRFISRSLVTSHAGCYDNGKDGWDDDDGGGEIALIFAFPCTSRRSWNGTLRSCLRARLVKNTTQTQWTSMYVGPPAMMSSTLGWLGFAHFYAVFFFARKLCPLIFGRKQIKRKSKYFDFFSAKYFDSYVVCFLWFLLRLTHWSSFNHTNQSLSKLWSNKH